MYKLFVKNVSLEKKEIDNDKCVLRPKKKKKKNKYRPAPFNVHIRLVYRCFSIDGFVFRERLIYDTARRLRERAYDAVPDAE